MSGTKDDVRDELDAWIGQRQQQIADQHIARPHGARAGPRCRRASSSPPITTKAAMREDVLWLKASKLPSMRVLRPHAGDDAGCQDCLAGAQQANLQRLGVGERTAARGSSGWVRGASAPAPGSATATPLTAASVISITDQREHDMNANQAADMPAGTGLAGAWPQIAAIRRQQPRDRAPAGRASRQTSATSRASTTKPSRVMPMVSHSAVAKDALQCGSTCTSPTQRDQRGDAQRGPEPGVAPAPPRQATSTAGSSRSTTTRWGRNDPAWRDL